MQKKQIVISIHGIRTYAKWQKTLNNYLPSKHFTHYPFDYGYVDATYLFIPFLQKKVLIKFREFYLELKEKYKLDEYNRPSIIAHSFGTYIIGNILLKYNDMYFDKVILCGSILNHNFEWEHIIANNQIYRVLNEIGYEDYWIRMGTKFSIVGNSGLIGFNINSNFILEKPYEKFQHSDFFDKGHMSNWKIFLKDPLSMKLNILHGKDITDIKLFDKLLLKAHEIDRNIFDPTKLANADIPRGLSLNWISIEPDIYTFLTDNVKVTRGYINAMPIKEEIFNEIKSGTLRDNQIMPEHLESYMMNHNNTIRLYLMSIAIEPSIRDLRCGHYQFAFELLINSFIEKLIYYYRTKRIKVIEIVAAAWTDEGKRLCKILGMNENGNTDPENNQIMYLNLSSSSNNNIYRGLKRLQKEYM